MKKGKLIVIDGTDGSGKATQAELLKKRMIKSGIKAEVINFPRYYSNFFGKFIGECLRGEHGDFLKLDPYIVSVLFAADRWESGKKIETWLKKGVTVISDRYASANQIHQGSKIPNPQKRKKLIDWIEKMEFGVFKIPRPDRILYLNITAEKNIELIKKKGNRKYLSKKADQHESSEAHIKDTKKSAGHMLKLNNRWIDIECMKNGQLMTKKEINDIIWEKLKKTFG